MGQVVRLPHSAERERSDSWNEVMSGWALATKLGRDSQIAKSGVKKSGNMAA